jgi:tetratricopeptide (TPR) repeat protein
VSDRRRSRAERDGDRAVVLLERSLQAGDRAALEQAVTLLRRALAATSASDPHRGRYLSNLGAALQTRFRRTGNIADLDEAIRTITEALRVGPAGGSGRTTELSNLGYSLRLRFEQAGDMADLTEAIRLGRAAIEAAPLDEERYYYLDSLASSLSILFVSTEQLPAADEAIALARAAVRAAPVGHPERPRYLSNLSASLSARFQRTGKIADLNDAIDAGRAALREAPANDAERARYLSNLSTALRSRYKRLSAPGDIAEAIDLQREALQATPEGHPERPGYQSSLGNALRNRFDWAGDAADATASTEALRAAVRALRPGHPERPLYLSNLAVALQSRFFQTGQLAYLNEAIDALRTAVTAAAAGHPDRRRGLANLGNALRVRSEQVGDPADLTEAVDTLQAAVTATPAGHPEYPGIMFNLAVALAKRFEHSALGQHLPGAPSSQPSDLTAAIAALRDAAGAIPADHPDRARILDYLGFVLRTRAVHTSDAADFADAVEVGRAAVGGVPAGHPERADYMATLGATLLARAEQAGELADLTAAIEISRAVLDAVPANYPARTVYLYRLGTALETKFTWTGDVRVLDEALAVFRAAAGIEVGAVRARLLAALERGKLAAEHGAVEEAEAGYAAAIELLPLMAWHGLGWNARLEYLARLAGIAGDAAACAISAGHLEHAVELLDNGRSILWSQVLSLRSDLDRLRLEYPALANRLDNIRAILDQRGDDTARRELVIRSADEYDRLVAHARTRPGFEAFLSAPSFTDLTANAGDNLVVMVNVSRYRCDALAVTSSGVRLIPLPGLTAEAVGDNARRYLRALADARGKQHGAAAQQVIGDVLSWLWDVITEPVLDALSFTASPAADERSWPRLWWCPVRALTVLPLHAAAKPGTGTAVLDRVVSSYTPTLRALGKARGAGLPPAAAPSVLLVTMPTTPYLRGGAPLPGVDEEATAVTGSFPGACTVRTAAAATRAAVLADLPRHPFAHFACHGTIKLKMPGESGLCLADGRLTIEELSHCELGAARFAFLSACHTGAPGANLADEAITMAAAVQLAGFRHVIATLWAIADGSAPLVAREVYRVLLGNGAGDGDLPVAYALHCVVRMLRDRGAPAIQWAPYIHSGP